MVEFNLVLLGFTGFYLVLLNFTGFYLVLLGLLGFPGLYLVLPGLTGSWLILPGFTGFLSCFSVVFTGFLYASSSRIMFYWVSLGFTGF